MKLISVKKVREIIMSQINEKEAIEHAINFLKKEGESVIECIRITHASKELMERELERSYEHGHFLVEISIVTPADAKYKVTDPRGDITVVRVNDDTSESEYMTVL